MISGERVGAVNEYVERFERWVGGPPATRRELRAELEAHLREAESQGRLAEALDGLGSPQQAARVFVASRSLPPAPRWRRIVGAAVDYGSLVLIIEIAALVAWLAGPPFTVSVGPLAVQVSCSGSECLSGWGPLFFALLLGALFWFVVVLTLLEWRYGRTPGKTVARTRVLSDEGTAITLGQALIRRLPLVLSGPLQIVDWAFALRGPTYQRGFDRLARTIVVDDRSRSGTTAP